jgi:hypothetical protein
VTIPPHVIPVLLQHAKEYAGEEFSFVDRNGQRVRSNAVYQAFVRARMKVGVTISFHNLRHTGQSLAAATGASLVDLKQRLGHSSTAAAQRYMHAVEGRDARIAEACLGWPRAGTPPSSRRASERGEMLHEMLQAPAKGSVDLRLCLFLKIGRSAVRPRPWPPVSGRSRCF